MPTSSSAAAPAANGTTSSHGTVGARTAGAASRPTSSASGARIAGATTVAGPSTTRARPAPTVPAKRPVTAMSRSTDSATTQKRISSRATPTSIATAREASTAKPVSSASARSASQSRIAAKTASTSEPVPPLPSSSQTRASASSASRAASSSAPSSQAAQRPDILVRQLRSELTAEGATLQFPELPVQTLDRSALHHRLITLAEGYLQPASTDLHSASLYSFLALTLFPTSIDAHRLRARCLLSVGHGAVFPYSPKTSIKSCARAALRILTEGPAQVFGDIECAKIWAEACRVLGRLEEAEQVFAWCLQVQQPSTSNVEQRKHNFGAMPSLVSAAQRDEAVSLVRLARLEKESRKMEAAERRLIDARGKDPWNWAAWINLCDLGTAPLALAAFPDGMVAHQTSSFLENALSAVEKEVSFAFASLDLANPSSGAASRTAGAASEQRPGPRPLVGASSTSSSSSSSLTAKRSRTGPGVSSTLNPSARSVGAENSRAGPPRSTVRPTGTMARTLSQARTNERPASSLSSASRSSVPDKPSQPVRVTAATFTDGTRKVSSRLTPATLASAAPRRTASGRTVPTSATSVPTAPSVNGRPIRMETTSSESDVADTGLGVKTGTSVGASKEPSGSKSAVIVPTMESMRSNVLKGAAEEAARWRLVDYEVVRLVRLLAGVFKDAKEYKGMKALRSFSQHAVAGMDRDSLKAIGDSAEVGVLLGRIYHDMAQYAEAEQCFNTAIKSQHKGIEGMDIFSLVLYHLNRHEALSTLAQRLMAIDADAVETHVAIGNLFSLNHSPSIALRSFRRGCLASPEYAYSYTLAGHECLTLNQPLKALRFFREAVKIDQRHWNGWSGLGTMLSSEGKWQQAQAMVVQACQLNASNAGLWEVLGVISERVGDRNAALDCYQKASMLNTKSSGAGLRKAELLWTMNRHELAHSALLQVVKQLPNEPRAHLLLAESYMRKGGGSFAPLAISRSRNSAGELTTSAPVDTMNTKAKAVGEPVAPYRYQEEVARHLAIAVDLEPSLNRRVKAMAEGMSATLRGQTGSAGTSQSTTRGPDVTIGSSFSGEESQRAYSEEVDDLDGEEVSRSYLGAADQSGVLEYDDSMGVLRDEENVDEGEGEGSALGEEEEDVSGSMVDGDEEMASDENLLLQQQQSQRSSFVEDGDEVEVEDGESEEVEGEGEEEEEEEGDEVGEEELGEEGAEVSDDGQEVIDYEEEGDVDEDREEGQQDVAADYEAEEQEGDAVDSDVERSFAHEGSQSGEMSIE